MKEDLFAGCPDETLSAIYASDGSVLILRCLLMSRVVLEMV
jgi:hypothetical protein